MCAKRTAETIKEDDYPRFKVRADIKSFTTYTQPDKSFYLCPKAREIAPLPGRKLPAIADKVKNNWRIHLSCSEKILDLSDPEQVKFFESIPEILGNNASVVFYIKYWKPSSENSNRQDNTAQEIEGTFFFDGIACTRI
ncbi:Oidioi.mRNA.OKI2018_I69.chr1.g1348.t1.cds [Oikopleura dioica]|uniref:Oidioi.mRNA.OKI2018_I69.chr1.g1348.t1.cds n=1 Tax=Oikopleura dioica TaxID=34765 RepID=A0ABN7SUN5_OIKDI|nr:Oidioi.mRNA.OKI2018_I69.chr1.g1348.t1.cds [Oikopleura dioica]